MSTHETLLYIDFGLAAVGLVMNTTVIVILLRRNWRFAAILELLDVIEQQQQEVEMIRQDWERRGEGRWPDEAVG